MTTIGMTLPFAWIGDGFGRAGTAIWARFQQARRLRETRRYLEQMDDHMLQDLGVSRAQAGFELDNLSRHPHL